MKFSEKVIMFNRAIEFTGLLPPGIRIMNPFLESPEAMDKSSLFYRLFYNDNQKRRIILGINPGRHGAGITGVPFTDTIRMESRCNINIEGFRSYELSSVFVYDMIDFFGGPEKFYSLYYINSICPLGFVKTNDKGREVNYNYYDSPLLFNSVKSFITDSINKQLDFGIDRETAFCLGTGKNFKYLTSLNNEFNFFSKIIPLEHPRYIMQYKLKAKEYYINKFCKYLKT